ncbi:heavy metal translocating P-type ATPase [Acinetobacter rudis]|uniref:Heavy metal translocating P-type ATPase n=1 Tax=Acinetobacter rudis TaxID=632955 RepID=A0AAW8J496_9GAMM|nr:heavy metal translocating P-type ATPase [Acinetobacter rudis]MDQ8934213.1 heavy metal translocating P-type ATPase [Acinetobacter rudis]MDQ9016479.1 heavy metal translocating P-type ATPase [Acinetobacter rudis]
MSQLDKEDVQADVKVKESNCCASSTQSSTHSHCSHSKTQEAKDSACCGGDLAQKKVESCCNSAAKPTKTSSCCDSTLNQDKNASCGHATPILNEVNSCCSSGSTCASTQTEQTLPQLGATTREGEYYRSNMRIMQMDCPTEEGLIQKKLGQMPEVIRLEFNLMQRVLTVVYTEDALPKVVKALQELDFEPELANEQGKFAAAAVEKKQSIWILVIAGIFALAAEISGWIDLPMWVAIVSSLIAIALSGVGTYKKGLLALKNMNLNINALMSIAVTGAVLIGQWPEAAMVMVLFTLAELIEARSLERARNAIGQLMQLAPERVTVLQADGQWKEIDAADVDIDSTVRVKPGEKIGLDGVIVKGQSSIDQSPITGESLPVDKVEGDEIFAGTINVAGSFEYRVIAKANDTALARIIHAVEEAQGEKAPTQRFVDRFAKVYTPLVFVFAILVAVIPPLFMGELWFDWIYKALVILVIACPCALVISTPVTVVSGLAAAARLGILIKGGVYLEQGRLLNYMAFDKTGTITFGKPKQTDFVVLSGDPIQVKQLVVSLAGRSDHPVSQAMVQADTTATVHLEVDDFTALAGLGTRGVIAGESYWLGNHRLIHELEYCSPALEAQIEALEKQGKTVVLLAKPQQVLALIAVADTVKPNSAEAMTQLQQMGVKTLMLSGDNSHTAKVIAEQVGMTDARGNLLPADKLNLVASYADTSHIGMVGDGINDAPALARANIGFAMGAMGTDVAIETADVALMDDDLRKIPSFIRLSQQTHRILIQNISLALITKLFFLVITMMGLGSMWMAVFADVGVSLLVVANGLRLLGHK